MRRRHRRHSTQGTAPARRFRTNRRRHQIVKSRNYLREFRERQERRARRNRQDSLTMSRVPRDRIPRSERLIINPKRRKRSENIAQSRRDNRRRLRRIVPSIVTLSTPNRMRHSQRIPDSRNPIRRNDRPGGILRPDNCIEKKRERRASIIAQGSGGRNQATNYKSHRSC